MNRIQKLFSFCLTLLVVIGCSNDDNGVKTSPDSNNAILRIEVENFTETPQMYSKFISLQFQSQNEVAEELNLWEDESRTGDVFWFKKNIKALSILESYKSSSKIQSGGFAFSVTKLDDDAAPLKIVIKMYADNILFQEEIIEVDTSIKTEYFPFACVWN